MAEKSKVDVHEPLLSQLGIKPGFIDANGPAVDMEALRRYANGNAGPEEKQMVEEYVTKFRTWFKSFGDVLEQR